MTTEEVKLYFDKALKALHESQFNLEGKLYNVTIVRAYYAMFYAATALLGSQNVTAKSHTGLIQVFGKHLINPGLLEPKFGRKLSNAFQLRLDSDYNITLTPDAALAEDILHDAREFVDRAEQYLRREGWL